MTVLDRPPGISVRPSAPGPTRAERRSRFAVYFTKYGWIHALLLMSVWLFLFPFAWMVATSFKTDEELLTPSPLPEVLRFREASPYVRPAISPRKPADVTVARWDEMLPLLSEAAAAAIGRYEGAHAAVPSMVPIDAAGHRASATAILVDGIVAKLDRRLWTAPNNELIAAFEGLVNDSAVAGALGDSLARLELMSLQLRTLDLHIFNLTDGADFAKTWRVESGPAKLFKTGDTTLLSYHYDSASSEPIVLRYDFHLPPGMQPADLHKLTLTMGADNSWHRLTATLDMGGSQWVADECTYIAQYRAMSLILQPPTFDDQAMRAKVWISLKNVGAAPEVARGSDVSAGVPASLRIIVSPSSTLRANFGKALRNYDRAFKSVPFWRYITNSMLLVVLCTVGSLFSATFVAYAFARLHWPGRSVAFLILLSTMMLPGQVTMIPGFMIWRAVHWYNTLNPLWVPAFFGSAFFIFLMTQHMRTIPKDLEEAARLDGLNAVQSWYYIILPNVTPTLAAIAILAFMGSWNEFMGPLIYLRDQTRFPLSLGLYGLGLLRTQPGTDYSWTVVMAGNILMTAPVIAVFFLFQRYFVQGMTLTGMKG